MTSGLGVGRDHRLASQTCTVGGTGRRCRGPINNRKKHLSDFRWSGRSHLRLSPPLCEAHPFAWLLGASLFMPPVWQSRNTGLG